MSTAIQTSKVIQGDFALIRSIDRIPEICISIRIAQVDSFLQKLIPVLVSADVKIKWIADQLTLSRFLANGFKGDHVGTAFIIEHKQLFSDMNAGMLGPQAVGRFATIYPVSMTQGVVLTKALVALAENYQGPQIQAYYQISPCIYWKEKPPKELVAEKNNARKLVGKNIGGFIPTALIREAPKGDIYKGVGFKSFRLYEVCIKEGRPWVLEDAHGRDIRDRLFWQRTVLEEIGSRIPTPKVLKSVVKNGNGYLILEFIEGNLLPVVLDRLRNNLSWQDIPKETRREMLGYYLQILSIVEQIHSLGYIHRDLQDNNFIIKPKGEVYICDFELAYSLEKAFPAYPMGTFGYVSPHQMMGITPTFQDDVFSLGALLYFFLMGVHPGVLINAYDVNMRKLALIQDERLCSLIRRSLSEPEVRPSLEALREGIQQSMDLLGV